jgi:hypothetical protein
LQRIAPSVETQVIQRVSDCPGATINSAAVGSSPCVLDPGADLRAAVESHDPSLPGSSRLGLVMPMEGSRWSVSLCVNHGETPPSDIDGFMAFAKSLRMPKIDVARQHLEDLALQAVAVRDVPRPCHAPDTRGG